MTDHVGRTPPAAGERAGEHARRDQLFAASVDRLHRETDRMFGKLLLAQWAFAILLALVISPWSYDGDERHLHFHVVAAISFGAVINSLPMVLIRVRPGWWGTRHTIAVVQMLWSALLIMITGGRIETHFHVFGSLAFLAMYRDWRVLPTATIVVAVDHLARGLWWPDSVYGIANPEWWRSLEHAAWVAFEDVVLVIACLRGVRDMRAAASREARLERTKAIVERKVQERTEELHDSATRYRSLVEDTAAVPFEIGMPSLQLRYIAPQAMRLFDCSASELGDQAFLRTLVHPDDIDHVRAAIREHWNGKRLTAEPIDFRITTKLARELHVRMLLSACDKQRLRGIMLDVTRQRQLEIELQQAQKLESVGRLAAGVAHEINTPVQFVSDSVDFVRSSVCDLIAIVRRQQEALQGVLADRVDASVVASAVDAAAAADLPYLADEMPRALERASDGLDRVSRIVRSMKVFAHSQGDASSVDLNSAIDSTLTIARNEYRYVADLVTSYGELPPVWCHAGEINQAVLNIVVNAAHAIADVHAATGERGTLRVHTCRDGETVAISISDTGPGIPDAVRQRMFDPFFTTKTVGRGTGQGLAIARSIVVEKHRGTLTCETKLGSGTTFQIRVPIDSRQMEAAA